MEIVLSVNISFMVYALFLTTNEKKHPRGPWAESYAFLVLV